MKEITIKKLLTDKQDPSLKLFLKEVAKIPLLTAEEEFKIAQKAKNGDKEAYNKLIVSNLRFVISVAKQYQNKGLSLVDLIQEGICGLLEAGKKFDATRGFKFISYAVWWIRQSIIIALSSQTRTVRIPMNQIISINKINKVITKLEQKYDRNPSEEEIGEEAQMTSEAVVTSLNAYRKPLSLETQFDDDTENTLIDVLPNPNIRPIEESILDDERYLEIVKILNNLSNREQDIIRLFFGIGTITMQCEEIAARFGMCCERIRQIRDGAIEKLRQEYINELKELLV